MKRDLINPTHHIILWSTKEIHGVGIFDFSHLNFHQRLEMVVDQQGFSYYPQAYICFLEPKILEGILGITPLYGFYELVSPGERRGMNVCK